MEALVLKVFTVLFRMVGILLVAGTMMCVMIDIQKLAFTSHRRGLVSMMSVNSQLVGKTWVNNNGGVFEKQKRNKIQK